MTSVPRLILAIAEENTWNFSVCSSLEREMHFRVRRVLPDTQQAGALIHSLQPDAVVILARPIPLMMRGWIHRTAETENLPFFILAPELDQLCDEKRIVWVRADAAAQPPESVTQSLGIKLRLVLNQYRKPQPAAAAAHPQTAPATAMKSVKTGPFGNKLIAMGASMGGVEAMEKVLTVLPSDMPGIVVVQHMPKGFTEMYAQRLDAECELHVVQASDGDVVEEGTVYIAPGSLHMTIQKRSEGGYGIHVQDGERVTGHKPSVNVLFDSVAKSAGKNALGVIMTGMGDDGAIGLLAMRTAGAFTVGQDAATALVYGMPKVAFENGAVCKQVPLGDIPKEMLKYAAK